MGREEGRRERRKGREEEIEGGCWKEAYFLSTESFEDILCSKLNDPSARILTRKFH